MIERTNRIPSDISLYQILRKRQILHGRWTPNIACTQRKIALPHQHYGQDRSSSSYGYGDGWERWHLFPCQILNGQMDTILVFLFLTMIAGQEDEITPDAKTMDQVDAHCWPTTRSARTRFGRIVLGKPGR
jgi:hypothetical protein